MHGYPSHEWVQYFAGYSAWVRNRNGGQRSWWSPRGWFIPGFRWVDDDEHEDIQTAQFAILDSVAAAITGESSVDEMNRRLYARYRKYGAQDVDNFREYFHNGILVSLALTGSEVDGGGVRRRKPRTRRREVIGSISWPRRAGPQLRAPGPFGHGGKPYRAGVERVRRLRHQERLSKKTGSAEEGRGMSVESLRLAGNGERRRRYR